jgi:hypothetical protein
VDLFTFVGWVVTVVALVTLAWPLNVPVMALAYRVRRGSEPVDFEPVEFWLRSLLAALGPAGMSLVLVVLAWALVVGAELPGGPTLLILFVAYLPAAVAYVTWTFGLDEMLDGLGVFLLYVLLPVLPLLLVGWLTGLWRALASSAPWLGLFPHTT